MPAFDSNVYSARSLRVEPIVPRLSPAPGRSRTPTRAPTPEPVTPPPPAPTASPRRAPRAARAGLDLDDALADLNPDGVMIDFEDDDDAPPRR